MVLQWRVSRIYKSVSQSVHSIYEILIAIGPPMVVDPMDEPVRKKPNMDLINSVNSKIGKMESASSAGNNVQPEKESREERRRKRKSRWGGQETTEKTFIPGMPRPSWGPPKPLGPRPGPPLRPRIGPLGRPRPQYGPSAYARPSGPPGPLGPPRPQAYGPPRPQPMPQGPLRPPGPSNSFSGPPSAPMQRPSIPPSAPNGPSGPPGPPSSAPISGPGFYQFFELGIYFGNIIMQIGGYALCIIFGLMCLLIIWKVASICLGKIQF